MSKKMSIPLKEVKILWAKSGGKCAICKADLIGELECETQYLLGQMAHIEGENPGSARYNAAMSDNARCLCTNLILLCPTHHTIIDKDTINYTVERLIRIKEEHEVWVSNSLRVNMPNITFAELDVTLKYLGSTAIGGEMNYKLLIPPKEKINRNGLSIEVENMITLGMLQINQVKKYLNTHPDRQFAERLRNGFVNEYNRLKTSGCTGDELFYDLWDFAANRSNDFKIKAAGLAVLVYFFELCEVFEK